MLVLVQSLCGDDCQRLIRVGIMVCLVVEVIQAAPLEDNFMMVENSVLELLCGGFVMVEVSWDWFWGL